MSQFEFDEQNFSSNVGLVDAEVQERQLEAPARKICAVIGEVVSHEIEVETATTTYEVPNETQSHLHAVSNTPENETHASVREIDELFPDLHLTEREKVMLSAISNTAGMSFKAMDVFPRFDDLSDVSSVSYFRKFLRKFLTSPYAEMLVMEGAGRTTSYNWLGESLPLAITHGLPDKRAEVVTYNFDERHFSDQVAVLSFIGIDLEFKGGKKELTAKNKPLEVSQLSVEVLIELAMHEGRMTVGRLARSKRLQAAGIRPDTIDELHAALAQIEQAMEDHGIAWQKNTLYLEDKSVTTIALGDLDEIRRKSEIAEQTDYLRNRGLRLPRGIPYKKVDERAIALMLTPSEKIAQRLADGDDYKQFGLCKVVESEVFWPVEGSFAAAEPAVDVCKSCKVGTICMTDALENEFDKGVWGGLSERERRAYLRKNPKVKKSS